MYRTVRESWAGTVCRDWPLRGRIRVASDRKRDVPLVGQGGGASNLKQEVQWDQGLGPHMDMAMPQPNFAHHAYKPKTALEGQYAPIGGPDWCFVAPTGCECTLIVTDHHSRVVQWSLRVIKMYVSAIPCSSFPVEMVFLCLLHGL